MFDFDGKAAEVSVDFVCKDGREGGLYLADTVAAALREAYEAGHKDKSIEDTTLALERDMFLTEHDENVRLHTQVEELVELLDQINGAFYARTSRKAWLALIEKTKPLIRKVQSEKEPCQMGCNCSLHDMSDDDSRGAFGGKKK